MLPGFVDSHGHAVLGGLQALSANLLAPPDGEVRDIASLKDSLARWIEDNAAWYELGIGGKCVGYRYTRGISLPIVEYRDGVGNYLTYVHGAGATRFGHRRIRTDFR